jgi:hypothetical protein
MFWKICIVLLFLISGCGYIEDEVKDDLEDDYLHLIPNTCDITSTTKILGVEPDKYAHVEFSYGPAHAGYLCNSIVAIYFYYSTELVFEIVWSWPEPGKYDEIFYFQGFQFTKVLAKGTALCDCGASHISQDKWEEFPQDD